MSLLSRLGRFPLFSRTRRVAPVVAVMAMAFFALRSPSQIAPLPADPVEQWSMGFWAPWGYDHVVSDIDWDALTHVMHVAIEPLSDGSVLVSDPDFHANAHALISAAHAHNAKVLLNVWSGATSDFNGAITNHLDTFLTHIMNTVEFFGYDGVDIDWEKGLNKTAMTTFLRALRLRLGDKILTADAINNDYAYWGTAHQYLDRVNVMTYDMAGTWNHYSWSNAALYSDACNCVWSVELARSRMTAAGVPAAKLNIGIPFYGWVSSGGGITGPRQPWGLFLPALSQINYRVIPTRYNMSAPLWDPVAQVPYLSVTNGWVTYDNEKSITAKVDYVRSHNLGGWIIWELSQDYMPDQNLKHPLLNAIKLAMKPKPVPPPPVAPPVVVAPPEPPPAPVENAVTPPVEAPVAPPEQNATETPAATPTE